MHVSHYLSLLDNLILNNLDNKHKLTNLYSGMKGVGGGGSVGCKKETAIA